MISAANLSGIYTFLYLLGFCVLLIITGLVSYLSKDVNKADEENKLKKYSGKDFLIILLCCGMLYFLVKIMINVI